ncbi:MAG: hypothetical protein GF313_07660 [Caldithrix sp.]|nr:hypothetical protein [Caldithrix sp.]
MLQISSRKASKSNLSLKQLTGWLTVLFLSIMMAGPSLHGQALNIPAAEYGLSLGNSKEFTGIRINVRDKNVQKINGFNLTFWSPVENNVAIYNGLSLGVMAKGGHLNGIHTGIIGAAAQYKINGIAFGLLGAGAGEAINGIAFGLLGAGSGGTIQGIALGGLGAGAGSNFKGISLGGLGSGTGGDFTGIAIGGLGAGAGGNYTGIGIGGLGLGAGGHFKGIGFGGLGVGAGGDFTGAGFGMVGVGCGGTLRGLAVGGFGTGAPVIKGMTLSGVASGAEKFIGVNGSIGVLRIPDGGQFKGLSVSTFNWIKGNQTGITIGLLNIAKELNGLQVGILNYADNNPKWLRVLPILNVHLN